MKKTRTKSAPSLFFCKKKYPIQRWGKRAMGIEPTSKAWEALILPMNYARKVCAEIKRDGEKITTRRV